MDKYNPRKWLETQVETAVQLSDRPPKIAVWSVVLTLSSDVVEILKRRGVVYDFAGYMWFDYKAGGQTVCIPIQITE